MPLPTPAELHSQLTLTIARAANIKACYDTEHPGPLSLKELLNIQKSLANYFTGQVDAHLKDQHS
jgi:hypothetical protein